MRDYGAEVSEQMAIISAAMLRITEIVTEHRREIDRPADGFAYCCECKSVDCPHRVFKGKKAGCFDAEKS